MAKQFKIKQVSDTKFNNLPSRNVRKDGKKVGVDSKGYRYYHARFVPESLRVVKVGAEIHLYICDEEGNVYVNAPSSFQKGSIWLRKTDRVKDGVGVRPVDEDEDNDED